MNRLKSKSLVVGIIGVALVLGLAGWMLASPSSAQGVRFERYLPADTVGFVQVNNLRAQALKVINSEAWHAFTKENQSASSLFMLGANHAGALDASYALALVGTGAGEDGRPQPQFALVAEFNSRSSQRVFENRVLRFVKEANEKSISTKTEQYGDVSINLINDASQHGFAYAQVGTTLFLSNTAGAVKKVLDVRGGKVKSLESNESFQQARAAGARQDEGIFGFLDGAALTRLIDNAQGRDGHEVAAFRQLFHGTGASSVQSVAFTSNFVDGRVVERFMVVAPGKEAGLLRTLADNPPTQQALLALVPEDALQAFDASIANAPQTFEQFESLVNGIAEQAGKKSFDDLLNEVSSKISIDLREDVVRALGTEICLAQLPAGEERKGVLILNLKDQGRFAQALERLAQHKKRVVTESEYKGVTIEQVAGEEGHALNYAFVSGNFIASGDAQTIERVIDTAQGAPALPAGASYRAASASLSGSPQFVYYNSNADYLNHLGRILTSDGSEFKTTGQRADLQPSFAFGVSRPEGFYVESHTPLGTFPRL
ncbi:MAG: DUF3352 domain-containing protein, partial [Acidobacteria bacterium]|nr:DUF3352 domain-containing protein [Acidobacteriota bacterium]